MQILVFSVLIVIKSIVNYLLVAPVSRKEGNNMSKFKLILAAIFDNIHALGFAYFSGSLLTKKSLE